MAFDSEDQLWIGTDRGLATIFSVGSAFGGDPSLLQPQWARTADGTSFLLRDLDIVDIAVDPADQKWIASSTGAWLLNAAGDEVLLHFTQENSPLFSDNVVAVAIDEESGRVYFATDVGLLSYDGEPRHWSWPIRNLKRRRSCWMQSSNLVPGVRTPEVQKRPM